MNARATAGDEIRTADSVLPLEILVMIVHGCLDDHIDLMLLTRLICMAFNLATDEASRQSMKKIFGEGTAELVADVHPTSSASSFFKIFKQEAGRLALSQRFLAEKEGILAGAIRLVDISEVKNPMQLFSKKPNFSELSRKKIDKLLLNLLAMAENDLYLPEPLFFFVSSAVHARAYETLVMLVEAINSMERKTISLKRVIDTIYDNAVCDYHEFEFVRLQKLIPRDIHDFICQTIISPTPPTIVIIHRPLLHIAALNKNLRLVKHLLSIGADLNQLDEKNNHILTFLEAKLRYDQILRGKEKLQEVFSYLKSYQQSQITPAVVETKPQQ